MVVKGFPDGGDELAQAHNALGLIQRGDGEDPADPSTVQAMAIVLNMPKSDPPHRLELLEAAAIASLQVCLSPEAAVNPAWHDALERWYGARIRKIARRARTAGQWAKVQDVPGVTACVGTAAARAFVPTAVSAVDPRIGKLQIQGTDLPREPEAGRRDVPTIVLNDDLGMSVGKAAAQVGHAAMLWAEAASAESVKKWVQEPGFNIREWDSADMGRAQDSHRGVVIVRDAGYTEVAPGSVTALAFD